MRKCTVCGHEFEPQEDGDGMCAFCFDDAKSQAGMEDARKNFEDWRAARPGLYREVD